MEMCQSVQEFQRGVEGGEGRGLGRCVGGIGGICTAV